MISLRRDDRDAGSIYDGRVRTAACDFAGGSVPRLVADLQRELRARGFLSVLGDFQRDAQHRPTEPNGVFGEATETAVHKFQIAAGLPRTAILVSPPATAPTVVVDGGGAAGGHLEAGRYTCQFSFAARSGETAAGPASAIFTVAAGQIPRVTLPSRPARVEKLRVYVIKQPPAATGSPVVARYAEVETTSVDLPDAISDRLQMPLPPGDLDGAMLVGVDVAADERYAGPVDGRVGPETRAQLDRWRVGTALASRLCRSGAPS